MSNNPAKYEVRIKQYLRSILDTSRSLRDNFFKALIHFVKMVRSTYGTRFSYLKLAIPESGDRKRLINLKLTGSVLSEVWGSSGLTFFPVC